MKITLNRKFKRALYVLISFSIFAGMFSPVCPAAREKVVAETIVEGNRRISETAVFSRIKTRPGEIFLQENLSEDLKRLHEWGPFSSIEVDARELADGSVTVVFQVEEKPIIKKILFEGNREMSDSDLREVIGSRAGEILSRSLLNADVTAIKELYDEDGYFQAEISYRIKTDEASGEAVVYFNIAEGHEVRVEKISIEGTDKIEEDDLLDVMETHARSLFSILHTGLFHEQEFEIDLERIKFYCRSQGYLDMEIAKVEKTFSDDGSKMYITITITEGRQYRAGTLSIVGNENFPEEDLAALVTLQPGDVFSFEALNKDANAIKEFYYARGYIDSSVRPRNVFNQETEEMDITFAIRENEISYINRIEISGNEITKDIVIRRELAVRPGEVFNGVKVKRSQERLYNLGYFQRVDISPAATRIPDEKDLAIRVEEKKTGEFMFGVGYSSIDDFIGFAEIGQGNFDLFNPPFFMGGGQKLKLRGEFGNTRSNYELSFVEPWLFGIPLSFGVDAYRRTWSWSDYNEKRIGFDIRLRRRLAEFIQMGLEYRLEQVDISDVDDDAYWAIQSEEGKNLISSLTPSLTRDTRDSFLIPTRGMKNTLSCEVAGGILGGDKNFIKTTFYTSFYQSIFEGHILGFRFRAGTAQPYGDTEIMPVYERFYLGGANTIRGFKYREVGPFYTEADGTDEPIGGNSMVMGSVEYTFPIVEMVRGALFCDIGNVWSDKDWEAGDHIFDNQWLKSLNSGAGIGLRLYLPIGPIKLDYGWPLRTGPDGWNDTGGRFHFNIGYAF